MNYDDILWGTKVVQKASAYANHLWYATEKNVLHGLDSNNVYVDTPDITWIGKEFSCGWWKVNEANRGIPYSWGSASTIEEFDKSLLEGKFAGNVPEDKSRYGSINCVGVDCSGLLTVCWSLPKRISTRDVPNIAKKLKDLEEINSGDVFLKIGSHVMIFKEFTSNKKQTAIIIDSTRSTGKVSEREVIVEELFNIGYEIYRKKNIIQIQ